MTKKRWIVLAVMLAACVCLTLGVLAMLPPRPGVTPANIERIEEGMTLAEVEELLGGPVEGYLKHRYTEIVWRHPYDGTLVTVCFDRDHRVIHYIWWPPETFLQKLQRVLHL